MHLYTSNLRLSRGKVTLDAVWIVNRIYCAFKHTARDFALRITIIHRLVFSFTDFTALLGSGFQQRASLWYWAHVLSSWRPAHTNFLLFWLPSQDSPVSQSQVKFVLQPTDSWPVLSSTHLGNETNFSSFFIIFRQLRVCSCGAPSLTRGWVCSLQLMLGLTSAVFLGFESRETRNYILLSKFQAPQIWKAKFLYLVRRGTGLVHTCSLPKLFCEVEIEVTLRLTVSQSVSQSVCLGVEHLCGTCDQILLPVGMFVWDLRSCFCWAPSLTRGRIYNLQCNHSMIRVAQNPQRYFTVSSENPPTRRARFPYLYPPGTGKPSYIHGHWVPFTSPLATRRCTVEVF
jgi:hypothetical protein